jgi:hypothetical protein
MNARVGQKPIEWPADGQNMYSSEQLPHIDVRLLYHCLTTFVHIIYYILDIGSDREATETFSHLGACATTTTR